MNTLLSEIDQILRSEISIKNFKDTNAYQLSYNKEYLWLKQAISENLLLSQCTIPSIISAFKNTALTGLSLNPVLKQSYLRPSKVQSVYRCYLEPTYQGLITKMIEATGCIDVYAMVHYENDVFECNFGTDKKITKHVPYYMSGSTDSGREFGAYAVAVLSEGVMKFEYIPIAKIIEIQNISEAYMADKANHTKQSPWSNAFRPDMIKKTAIKTLWNYMPKSGKKAETIATIINLDNEAQQYNFNKKIKTEEGVVFKLKAPVKTKENLKLEKEIM